jgi:MFS transporter, putative metabolite:H+ symporter
MNLSTQSSFTIPARIDRLPISREIWRILFLAGLAWLLESYDIGVIGTVLPSLTKQLQLSTFTSGVLAIASTLGIVLAIFPAGWFTDHFGRKNVLIIGTAWYAFFSLFCAFPSNVWLIVVFRFVAGFGMGAIFPIPYAMAAEFTPTRSRGMMTAMLDSFLSIGYFLSPLLGFLMTDLLPANLGWRGLFLIGGLPLLYIPLLMKWIPESPRWLQIRGRNTEADGIVKELEIAIERRSGTQLPSPDVESFSSLHDIDQSANLFQLRYLKRTIMMMVSFACILFIFYAIQTYTPTVLVKKGYDFGDAFLFTTLIVMASVPGKYLVGYTLERWGRKPTLIVFTVLAAVCAIIFGFSNSVALSLIFGMLMSFFGIGVDPAIKIYGAEQYPTSIRAMGVGSFECIGRLFGGALAPFIMAFILASGTVADSYFFIALVSVVGVLVVAFFGVETRGKSIEESSIQSRSHSAA